MTSSKDILSRPYSVADLEMLMLKYPYASTFRVLYLAELKCQSDVRYISELRTASIYSVDRKALYTFLDQTKKIDTKSAESHSSASSQPFDISELEQRPELEQTTPLTGADDIEKFLQSGGVRFSPTKPTEEQNVETLAVDFEPTYEEPFSETLAKIYIKQGKYDKAIKTFRKLMVKYPQKSVYFADQIRFFEKLVKNL